MAESFNLTTRRQLEKATESVCIQPDDLYNELSGLAGELASHCAQIRRQYRKSHKLHDCMGALLAMLQFYALTDYDGAFDEIMTYAKKHMAGIISQCKTGEAPSLLIDEDAFADQWGM